MKPRIFILDDEPAYCQMLTDILSALDYDIQSNINANEALHYIETSPVDVVITDLKMPAMSGVEVLEKVKAINPAIEVILITGHGTIDTAVEALKKGAFDFIKKPFTHHEIIPVISHAVDKKQLADELAELRTELYRKYNFSNIITRSKKITDLFDIIKQVADRKTPVLIQGESGTGKELIARAIHYNSIRKDKKFIAINCGAIPENLVESELFGHKKGSFTGAVAEKPGLFNAADRGTLFLDEIGELDQSSQVKLLRVLQNGEFMPIGATNPHRTDVRIIAATNRDLSSMVKEKTFREDLFYRINVVTLRLPPLRERREDIPLLASHFLEIYRGSSPVANLGHDFLKALTQYSFPGNIRELENIVEAAIIHCKGDTLTAACLPAGILSGQASGGDNHLLGIPVFSAAKAAFEKEYLQNALKNNDNNISKAAQAIGMQRSTFYNKMKELGLRIED